MNLKLRLQRMLQIVEESERVGALADIEQDILLNELREAYTELKFGQTENGKRKAENEVAVEPAVAELPTTPIAPIEEESVAESAVAELPITPIVPIEEESVAELPIAPTTPITPTPKRSALLSLYEDESKPVLGEQFHDAPSVADTIACPKGVAESTPVVSLREAIGVADKFMLIRELFDGDAEAYDKAIAALEAQPSFDDCVIYIAEHYAWSSNSAAAKLVMELLERKYN